MSCEGCHRNGPPLAAEFWVRESRDITACDLLKLMQACGCATTGRALDAERLEQAIENFSYVSQVRNSAGELMGYLSAVSDAASLVYIVHLMVHPAWRHRGIGSLLMNQLEARYRGVPVQLDASTSAVPFFEQRGYGCRPATHAMGKRPGLKAIP